MIYATLMIGIIPLGALGGLAIVIREKQNNSIAAHINERSQLRRSIPTDLDKLIYDIPMNRIRYVEAMQNYVYIAYLDAEGRLTKTLERTTLKSILELSADTTIYQSHRSFLVNREAIESVRGNAQGLLLKLSDSDKPIPVSRRFIPYFRDN